MVHGASVRTISSPTVPGATSQSFSSTIRTSTPGRGVPHVPSGDGFLPERNSECSRSCAAGGCFTRKLAITPSSTTVVVPVSRTVGQNRVVSNPSTRAIEPPFTSIA